MSRKRGKRTTGAKPNTEVMAETQMSADVVESNAPKPVDQDKPDQAPGVSTSDSAGIVAVIAPDEIPSDTAPEIAPEKAPAADEVPASNPGDEPTENQPVEQVSMISDESIQAAAQAAATKASPHLRNSDSSISRASAPQPGSGSADIGTTENSGGRSLVNWLALLLALLACLGVAALVYMDRDIQYYLQHRSHPETDKQIQGQLQAMATKFDDSTNGLRAELGVLSNFGATQDQLRNELAETKIKLVETSKQLKQSNESLQRQLQELQRTSRDDWLLAEVEYLLRLANQRLLTEGDLQGVESLLVSADRIVRDLDNVSLFPVRDALAHDLAAIRAVPAIDEEGTYLQLAALSDQVMQLPLLAVGGFQIDAAKEQEIVAEMTVWQRLLERAMNGLERFKQYFRLNTNRSEPLQELLTPNEEVYLRQNLRLMMEQSQLALLKQQQGVFDVSTASSLEWLRRYFSYNDQMTRSMIMQLEQLQSLKLNPQLPDISSSLKAVKEFNETLHRREEAAS